MAPSTWRRFLAAGAATVVLAVAVGLGLGGCTGSPSAATAAPITVYEPERRAAAPDIDGTLLDGGSYRLADHLGEVVVVNFWASWCAPCRVEQDDLERAYQAAKADKVSFLGVNIRDQRDQARKAVAAGGVSYPSLFDPDSSLALRFEEPPGTLPATIIIDREGRIAAVIRRALVYTDIVELINQVSRG